MNIKDYEARIDRLRNALIKADRWGVDVIETLIEEGYITEGDMWGD